MEMRSDILTGNVFHIYLYEQHKHKLSKFYLKCLFSNFYKKRVQSILSFNTKHSKNIETKYLRKLNNKNQASPHQLAKLHINVSEKYRKVYATKLITPEKWKTKKEDFYFLNMKSNKKVHCILKILLFQTQKFRHPNFLIIFRKFAKFQQFQYILRT